MSQIDLTKYIINSSGSWVNTANAKLPHRLTLTSFEDQVTLTGPLSVKITWYSENTTSGPGRKPVKHKHPIYSYVLEIPPGHNWDYKYKRENHNKGSFGNNDWFELTIENAACEIPATIGPQDTDIPCNVGVANIPNLGTFFPSPCEPCTPGASIGLPPGTAPTLGIPPAKGGCVRPRFFNGMCITSEDMETMLRWTRLKQQMQNRAMGQGVVWGLNVERDGRYIRVHPGYAVDCCGHDLVVTTPYCVEIDALLRDPAAVTDCDGQEPRRMHLLLEYQECPEEPRPVHGDPCSPEVNRCEMSRIRETVRLRLVPPRDYRSEGPVYGFLRELGIGDESESRGPERLYDDCRSAIAVPECLPFVFHLGGLNTDPYIWNDLELRPSTRESVAGVINMTQFTTVVMELKCDEGYGFAEELGTCFYCINTEDTFGSIEENQTLLTGRQPVAIFLDNNLHLEFETRNLTILRNGNPFLEVGSLAFNITLNRSDGSEFYESISVDLQPVSLEVLEQPEIWHCFTVPCSGGEGNHSLFPTMPPWSHCDPNNPNEAIDPKIIVLSVIHTWLTMQNERQGDSAGLSQASQIYSAAEQILGLDSEDDSGERRDLIDTLHRLLCTWCRQFLYPGPQCRGKLDGVVIGCVTVQGGDISRIDPWGGRRYVMHGPLLTHWGEQIGLAPLDVTVSRIMALVCCVAGLPMPQLGQIPNIIDSNSGNTLIINSLFEWIRAGRNLLYLHNDPPDRFPLGSEIVDTQELRLMDFVHHIVAGLQVESTSAPNDSNRWIRYRLVGAAGIEMLTPAPHAEG